MRPARIALAAAAIGAAFASGPASACTISASGVNFGAYNPISAAPLDGAGSISASCHPNIHAPVVSIGPGLSGSFLSRTMSNGTSSLNYNLYTSAARLIVWGDGTAGTLDVVLPTGTVSAGTRTFSATIYGRIPTGQHVEEGEYSDTLFITLTF